MKKLYVILPFLLVVLPLVGVATEYANDWMPGNLGARSTALGRSSVMDDGSSALFHNPAALAGIDYLQFSAYYTLNAPTQESGHLAALSENGEVQTTSAMAPLNMILVFPNTNLEYADLGLAYGVGFSQYYPRVNEYTWTYQENGASHSRTLERSPGINVLHLGAGFEVWKALKMGLTFHFIPRTEYFSKDVLYTDDAYVTGLAETFSTNNALFFRFGALYNLGQSLALGFTLVSPFEWVASEYWTNEDTTPREISLHRTPLTVGYGLAFTKGALRAQYEGSFYKYSQSEHRGELIEMDDGSGTRIGLEYGSTAKFRMGYYSESMPVRNSAETLPVPMTGLTFGFGYSFGKLSIDLALDHYSWTNDAFIQPMLPQVIALEDQISGNIFVAELSYKFVDGLPEILSSK